MHDPDSKNDRNAPVAGSESDRDALRDRARELLDRLELPGHAAAGDPVALGLEGALRRLEARNGTRYQGQPWQLVITLREFVKVLAGSVFKDEVRQAIEVVKAETKADLVERAFRAIAPKSRASEPADMGRFLDPSRWSIEQIPASSAAERFLRLSLLTSGMLVQEETIRAKGMTMRQAAEAI